jgi:hypothetical protein
MLLRRLPSWTVCLLLLGASALSFCQSGVPASAIQEKLNGTLTLTRITQNGSDLVKPGCILELRKPGLMMYSVAAPLPPLSTYKNGKISQGWGGFGRDFGNTLLSPPGVTSANYPQQKFAPGEKFWVIDAKAQKDNVSLILYSDPVEGIRYYGQLKFPYPKGHEPDPDDMMRSIEEVFLITPADTGAPAAEQPATPAAPSPMAPIAPPPPPPDAQAH